MTEEAKIHFDFWLDDYEAEALFGCINDSIGECNMHILELMSEYPPLQSKDEFIAGYKGHIKFLEELKGKLKNKREKNDD